MMENHPHLPPPLNKGVFDGASPKLTFIFGLIAGVAITTLIGLAIVLPKAYGSSKSAKTAAAAPTNTGAPTAPTFNNVKPVTDADYIRGDKNAKLTLIEYSDLECPFCKNFHPTMLKVMEEYQGKVNWVYRNYPLSFHANAQPEAEAALCVAKLGNADKHWAFIDKIFERTTSNGTGFALTALGPLAKEVGVNQDKFQKCLDSGEMKQRVLDETADGNTGGVSGTPSTLIVDRNGQTISGIPGAYPFEQVKAYIDKALAQL
ncbi:MAG: thioredoxin domain-containing protein [Patescibacteria group bacterium]